jgi:hypothetical protein
MRRALIGAAWSRMLVAFTLACGDSATTSPAPPTVTQLVVLSANSIPGNGGIIDVDVQVRDQAGNPVNGVVVTFEPSAGGSVFPATDTTRHVPSSLDGQAFTTWTLGGAPNTLRIAASGVSISISK